ncbi:MAG: hypothetical protein HYZ94_00540 [Candidatus Omnitrophica bacterium]|nr:hypothetical protein [Candidatus Omnitrophota bacterium]
MPSLNFPYRRYRGGLAPILSVQVRAGGRWRRLNGYVDSGAAFSIVTVAQAKQLGLLKIRGRNMAVTTSGRRTFRISLHRLWTKIGKDKLSITYGVPRDFDVDLNLFGRRDLFQRYRVCFDDARCVLTLVPHGK